MISTRVTAKTSEWKLFDTFEYESEIYVLSIS